MIPVNPHLLATASPPIPEAQGWATRYDGDLGPLVDLAQAVPGYPPHPDILEALASAAASPLMARYGAILGDADSARRLCRACLGELRQPDRRR